MKKLGFGTMRLPLLDAGDATSIDYEQVNRMVDHFMENGFTYFDTAYPYHDEKSEIAVRECLVKRYPRESFQLADKMPIFRITKSEEYQQIFDEQLEKCGVTYFDYYMLHNIGTERYGKTVELGGFEFVKKMKAEGKIRNLGFSYHDNADLLDRVLTEHPEVDFVQLQINYLDWESPVVQSRRCYETCVRHGKKVAVMEPIKGGTLANLPDEAKALLAETEGAGSAASYAIRFAASLPETYIVLSGMSNYDQMLDNTSYMKEFVPLSEEEQALVARFTEILNKAIAIPCTACKYCLEVCPIGVNVPVFFGLYNLYHTTSGKTNMYYERAVIGHAHAKDCLKCGLCESNCPQHLDIRGNLEKFAELYKEQEDRF